jgi:hypothetical protein
LLFPQQLIRSGYNTAQVGKILHWDGNNKDVWSFDSFENGWYDYQGKEWTWLNSSVMPNKKPIERFRDYEFTSKAIEFLERLLKEPKFFMLAVGFKLPHITIEVPHKYWEMYKGKQDQWKLSKRELRFPPSVNEVSYRCCGQPEFQFMREEGGKKFNRSVPIGNINQVWTNEMHDEMMAGYAAGISFVDSQLGRLLDTLDKHKLWGNTTVIFTADHGMHNGEKGLYEKWSLFEEAVRVPLMIAHPASPFKGEHYTAPVEHVDVFATVNELLKAPFDKKKVCKTGTKCVPLSGKSLAPVILGAKIYEKYWTHEQKTYNVTKLRGGKGGEKGESMPKMHMDFAVSQVVRCAPKTQVLDSLRAAEQARNQSEFTGQRKGHSQPYNRNAFWNDCDINNKNQKDEYAVMGYSMRTSQYRYTAYFHWNKTTERPDTVRMPFDQELYDHRNETLADFTHRETVNLARKPQFGPVLDMLRKNLADFITKKITFRIPLKHA